MMEELVHPQKRSSVLEKRLDRFTLVPAASALFYPFLLTAFHALVGTRAVTPSPLTIATATLILAVAFGVPFLGLADRQSVVKGKSVSVRVDLGGRSIIK